MENRAIIDVGSNSVRIMYPDGEKVVVTTKLGEGLAQSGALQADAIERTLDAIVELADGARAQGLAVEAFATEAVRSATNGDDFVALVKRFVPIKVLSGYEEALCGYLGATEGKGGLVIDVGGASTEVVFGQGFEPEFSVSIPVGIVRARDAFGTDYKGLFAHVKGMLENANLRPKVKQIVGIGGTVICAAAIDSGRSYDRRNTHGRAMSVDVLEGILARLVPMSVNERKQVVGLDPKRADTICQGLTIMLAVIKHLGAETIVASETDNLEGYRMLTGQASILV